MSRNSSLKFSDIARDLPWVKVVWNGLTIYNDYDSDEAIACWKGKFNNKDENPVEFILKHYGDNIIYSIYLRVVNCHHVILYIEGEE